MASPFLKLSTPVKIGLICCLIIVAAISIYLLGGDKRAVLIVLVGFIIVFLLLLLYIAFIKWQEKRKADKMGENIREEGQRKVRGISDPSVLAKISDLSRQFAEGIDKFRAAGKNIYSLPWYLLIGASGSGKSEAIRHCNVGFPPGLQDMLQGAGGTVNMNWWFTNQAVVLDTAGRYISQQVLPGSTNEWTEFLKLLNRSRPNCPINGLLLTISAESLIKFTADQLESEAGNIARQLDNLQRTLGVRFPVFVLITKSDLIVGFREFFESVNDPKMQHQVMGWSNTANLDTPFSADQVTEHLETVRQHLLKRRMGLLLDPVPTSDPNARKLDETDALFSFPESLMAIAPRLRRYLEMVFVAGEWSPKPLFLRGIYFTSSMREGSALDAELAAALNVPVDSLPEGRVWERDRAYFLRDLFMDKIFRERGLVTRSDDTRALMRRRRLSVLGAAIVAVVILIALTWLGAGSLRSSVGDEQTFWSKLNEVTGGDSSAAKVIVNPDGKSIQYQGSQAKVGTPLDMIFSARARAMNKIEIPLIFRMTAVVNTNMNTMRRNAAIALYDRDVLYPVVHEAAKLLKAQADALGDTGAANPDAPHWNDNSTKALIQLVRLESLAKNPYGTQFDPDPLFAAILSPQDYERYKSDDQAKLKEMFDWAYPHGTDTPAANLISSQDVTPTVQASLGKLNAYYLSRMSVTGGAPTTAALLVQALSDFHSADAAFGDWSARAPSTDDDFKQMAAAWNQDSGLKQRLRDSQTRIATAIRQLEEQKAASDQASLIDYYQAAVEHQRTDADAAYQALLGELAAYEKPATDQQLSQWRQQLTQQQSDLQAQLAALVPQGTKDQLNTLDSAYLSRTKSTDKVGDRRYQVVWKMYQVIDGEIADSLNAPPPVTLPDTGDALAQIDQNCDRAKSSLNNLIGIATKEDPLTAENAMLQLAIDRWIAPKQRSSIVQMALNQPLQVAADVEQMVSGVKTSRTMTWVVRCPDLPMTDIKQGEFQAEYHPGAAARVLTSWNKIAGCIQTKPEEPLRILNRADLAPLFQRFDQAAIKPYRDGYLNYWKGLLSPRIASQKSWADFHSQLPAGEAQVNRSLSDLCTAVEDALTTMQTILTIDPEIMKELSAAKARLADRDFRDDCDEALSSWRGLSETDILVARQNFMLALKNSGRPYLMVEAGQQMPDLATNYWRDMTFKGLSMLAGDFQLAARSSLERLKTLNRFPLAPPKTDDIPLGMQDLEDARQCVNALQAPPSGLPDVQNAKFNEQIGLLAGVRLSEDETKWITRISGILKCLPSPQRTSLVCNLSTIDTKTQQGYFGGPGPSTPLCFLTYVQNGTAGELRNAFPATSESLGSMKVPEDRDLTLRGNAIPAGPMSYTLIVHGPWAPLRLLYAPESKINADGTQWDVMVALASDNNDKRTVWIRLNFDRPVPDPRP